ncbi:LamG domain-containing protein [Amycolatopsis mediterranei]|uniref:LamG domain-containing protein n=1 Tax=Amycolatopsis mediterranei TaxID=33910 RepID=UPI003441064F
MGAGRLLRIGVLVGLMGAAVIVPDTALAAAPAAQPRDVTTAADAVTATAVARTFHHRVEVTGLETTSAQVFAEPTGVMGSVFHTGDFQVRRGTSWLPVDTKLTTRPDGSLAPNVTVNAMTFSGGGSGPLVTLAKDGKRLELSWPSALPKPVVAGDTVTYPDVVPGVDLRLRAQADDFAESLVVKTREAAANPALARIQHRVKATGLSLKAKNDGSVDAVDAAGKAVFSSPVTQIQDSAPMPGDAPAGKPTRKAAATKSTVDGDAVTTSTDQKLLADQNAQYPLVMSPNWTTNNNLGWTTIFNGPGSIPSSTHWNGANTDPEYSNGLGGALVARVGYSNWDSPTVTTRSFFKFDTSSLAGKPLLTGAFNTAVVYSPNCDSNTPGSDQLWVTNHDVNPDASWNNWSGPGNGSLLDTVNSVEKENWNYGCQGHRAVGFNLGNAPAVNPNGASSYWLQASNEGKALDWRKFITNPTLYITWNFPPDSPSATATDPTLPAPCRWCDGIPHLADNSIRLQGQIHDADGDPVRPVWDIYETAPGATTRSDDHRDTGDYLPSDSWHSSTLDTSALLTGTKVEWTLRGCDGKANGCPGTNWSGGAPFIVDHTTLDSAPQVDSPVYPADNAWHGGVNTPGAFTFSSALTLCPGRCLTQSIDHYLYGWQNPPTNSIDATSFGGNATVSLTPPGDGPHDLFVQAVTRGGRPSPTKTYHFYVRAGSGPLAQYDFEGNGKDTAYLGSRDATPSGNVTYTAGAVGSAASLAGDGGHLTAPSIFNTQAAFTVSAWAKVDPTGKDGVRTILSEVTPGLAEMSLMYRPENGGHWQFGMQSGTPLAGGWLTSKATALPGSWTHLDGVYDAVLHQISLYVNGEYDSTMDWTQQAEPSAPIQIGCTYWDNNACASPFKGLIDQVRLYDRVLSFDEIAEQVGRDNVMSGYWKLGDGAGKTARNEISGGPAGTLNAGAAFVPDGPIKGAVHFDGTSGAIDTGATAVRTDNSFSVSAWVKLDHLPDAGTDAVAVSQDGTSSGFALGVHDGEWAMTLRAPAAGSAAKANVVKPRCACAHYPAQAGLWTHVVGVLDVTGDGAFANIWVDGRFGYNVDTEEGPAGNPGALVIGRGQANGAPTAFFPGSVAEVRVFPYSVSDSQVENVLRQDNVKAGSWPLGGDAKDTSGHVPALDGTVLGGVTWGGGHDAAHDGKAAVLDGSTGSITAPRAVDTTGSYTVSAWANATKIGGSYREVLSADGGKNSAFMLRLTSDGHWAFSVTGADAAGSDADQIVGPAATANTWVHLVGVVDSSTYQASLYVNGVAAGSTALTDLEWGASNFVIGRGKWNGAPVEFFPGAIDGVNVYNRVLFADEIAALSGRDLNLVHDWPLTEKSGTTASDAAGVQPGTLSGGASFGPGPFGNAVQLDGSSGVVSTAPTDLRTDENFTVSAWVNLKQAATPPAQLTAVSLDGEHGSKFRLGYIIDDDQYANGVWVFDMPESDSKGAVVTKAAVSAIPSDVGTWTHLVGVYDAATKSLWLYVNGTRIGQGTLANPWNAGGGVQIGRAKVDDGPAQYWNGGVADARLYTGALSKDRVVSLYKSYPPVAH